MTATITMPRQKAPATVFRKEFDRDTDELTMRFNIGEADCIFEGRTIFLRIECDAETAWRRAKELNWNGATRVTPYGIDIDITHRLNKVWIDRVYEALPGY